MWNMMSSNIVAEAFNITSLCFASSWTPIGQCWDECFIDHKPSLLVQKYYMFRYNHRMSLDII